MRLLIATHARAPIGGVETYLRGIAPGLAARGHTLALLYEQRLEPAASGPSDPYAACAAEWCASASTPAAIAAARDWHPDLIWLHGLRDPAVESGLLPLAPAVAFVHDYQRSCPTGEKFQRWPQASPCARRASPACALVNFTRHCGRLRPSAFVAGFRAQRAAAGRLQGCAAVMVASHHMAAEIERLCPGHRWPLEVLPYPLLHPRGPAPQPLDSAPGRIAMLARLTAAKGGRELLLAAHQAQARLRRRLHITLAGNGPEQPALAQLALRLDLDADFPGWLSAPARDTLLRHSDLIAVPSLWPEPFGMTGLEAAAAAVPAVAFAVGGIPEWLQPGINGELAPGAPPTVSGLAAALERALASPAHWNRLRQGAWDAAAGFALDRHWPRLESVLAAAAARPAAAALPA